MTRVFALIGTDALIDSQIVADTNFVSANVASNWAHVVDITDMVPRPKIGDSYDGTNFYSAPVFGPTTAEIITHSLDGAKAFGAQLMNSFAVSNVLAGITQAGQTQNIANVTQYLYLYLSTGSLYAAIAECDQLSVNAAVATWAPYITPTLLQNYKNQIQTYLGIALT